MNKQELIEKYTNYNLGGTSRKALLIRFLRDLEQLDEPQKVTIPQFVADYIEFKKKNNFHVYGAMRVIEDHYDKNVPEWFYEKNIETFIRAWLDGYTVEKEKRYTVKVKGMGKFYECLNFDTTENRWKFFDCDNTKTYRTHHTRKELEEAGFGWVFDCEGIEVEEVEDE